AAGSRRGGDFGSSGVLQASRFRHAGLVSRGAGLRCGMAKSQAGKDRSAHLVEWSRLPNVCASRGRRLTIPLAQTSALCGRGCRMSVLVLRYRAILEGHAGLGVFDDGGGVAAALL